MPSTLLTTACFLCMVMFCRAFYSLNSLSCQKKALHNSRHLAISATQGSIEYLQEVILLRGRFFDHQNASCSELFRKLLDEEFFFDQAP